MKMMIAAMTAAAAIVGNAGAAQQDLISNPRGVIANFDAANIGPILTEMGAVWQTRTAENGQPYIAISAGGELVLNIIPTACQGANFTNCVGMNTVALFTGKSLNYQTVAAFNQKYWFSTAGIAEDGSAAYISRYEIADYGISRGNVAASIVNLIVLADVFRQELKTSKKTVSLQGYAEDMSSRSLNAAGVKALGGDVSTILTRHQTAMEETSELVLVMMADKNAPRNKIDNVTAKD